MVFDIRDSFIFFLALPLSNILSAIGKNSSFSTPQIPTARNVQEYGPPGIHLAPCSLLYHLPASLEEEEGTSVVGKCDV